MSFQSEGQDLSTVEIFAFNLKRLLDQRGKNANQLASYLQTAPNTTYNWLRLKASPQVGKLDAIATFLGVSVAELFAVPGAQAQQVNLQATYRIFSEAVSEMEAAAAKARAARNSMAAALGIPVPRETIGGAAEPLDRTRPKGVGPEGWEEDGE